MVNLLTATTHQGAYRNLLATVLEGEEIFVRGRPTVELLNNVLEITNPLSRCILTPGRRWNPWLAMSEGLWLLAGGEDIASLKPYNSRIAEFSDDGIITNGAYGKRLYANGLSSIVDLLRRDPDTRRAVIPIYEGRDSGAESKDIPCNTSVMFKLRDSALHMVVTNRSNDIHWGLFAVNLCQFSMLQETVAYLVGAAVGTQVHFSQSLHVYTDEHGQKITDAMMAVWDQNLETYRASKMFYDTGGMNTPLGEIKLHARLSLGMDGYAGRLRPFFDFAWEYLRAYRLHPTKKEKVNAVASLKETYNGQYPDWIRAAELWLAGN